MLVLSAHVRTMYIRYLAFRRNGNRFNDRQGGETETRGNKFSLEDEKCTGHEANELNFTSFARFTARKSRRD